MARVKPVVLNGCLSSVLSLLLSTCMLLGSMFLDRPLLSNSKTVLLGMGGILLGVLTNASLTMVEYWEQKREERHKQERANEPLQAWV